MPYQRRHDKKKSIHRFLVRSEYIKTHWTLRELAINIGYAPSTKFNAVVWEMVDDGLVRIQFSDHVKYSAVQSKVFVCLPEHYDDQLTFLELS